MKPAKLLLFVALVATVPAFAADPAGARRAPYTQPVTYKVKDTTPGTFIIIDRAPPPPKPPRYFPGWLAWLNFAAL